MKKSIKGLDEVVRVTEGHYEKRTGTSADVDQAKSEREIAVVGLHRRGGNAAQEEADAGRDLESVARRSRAARGARSSRSEAGPPPPPLAELIADRPRFAGRTWLRFGWGSRRPMANVRLQRANRFSDAYLLYQPYTFQNNAPFGKQSGTSWALGITVPLPLYNRNQGNIERARINVAQSQTATELSGAPAGDRGAAGTGRIPGERPDRASDIREHVLPGLERAYDDSLELFRGRGRSPSSSS